MDLIKLLIANRGEVAIRIIRGAEELGLQTATIFSEDDAGSPHVSRADEVHALIGVGATAYLDIEQVITTAKTSGSDAVHPGYGFLAESAELARRCAEEGIAFVGPSIEALELFGDKSRARNLAQEQDVPVLLGSAGPVTPDEAREFFLELGDNAAIVLKAVVGGGGRGMRVVESLDEIEVAYARCQSEAQAAFGDGAIYVEQLLPRARHLEVQVIGDGSGSVSHLGERECSIQRRHQKLVEIAPSPSLSADIRDAICAAAVRMAEAVSYQSLGTFEFLVDSTAEDRFVFIEANARLQVEHTVTEEVTGVDLVAAQLRLAQGESLKDLGLEQVSVPQARGFAVQARVNTEVLQPDGAIRPSGGQLTTFQPPAGPGVRVDTYAAAGYTTNPNFDSLLAKVIVHSPSDDFGAASRRLGRVLGEFQIGGPETNIGFLSKVIEHEDFVAQNVYTRWVDDHAEDLAVSVASDGNGKAPTIQAGGDINRKDPLASLDFFRGGEPTRQTGTAAPPRVVGPPNTDPVPAPLQGTVSEILVAEGDEIREGQLLMVMSALKMEHEEIGRAHV